MNSQRKQEIWRGVRIAAIMSAIVSIIFALYGHYVGLAWDGEGSFVTVLQSIGVGFLMTFPIAFILIGPWRLKTKVYFLGGFALIGILSTFFSSL